MVNIYKSSDLSVRKHNRILVQNCYFDIFEFNKLINILLYE